MSFRFGELSLRPIFKNMSSVVGDRIPRRYRDGVMGDDESCVLITYAGKKMPRSVAQDLFVQFRVGALVAAGLNLGIDRKSAGPSLDHEINRDKALEQGNRQSQAGKGTFRIVADGELAAPETCWQRSHHAQAVRGNASLNRWQGILAFRVELVLAQQLVIQNARKGRRRAVGLTNECKSV